MGLESRSSWQCLCGLVDVGTLSLSLGTEVTLLGVSHPPTGSQGGSRGSRANRQILFSASLECIRNALCPLTLSRHQLINPGQALFLPTDTVAVPLPMGWARLAWNVAQAVTHGQRWAWGKPSVWILQRWRPSVMTRLGAPCVPLLPAWTEVGI